MNNQIWEGVFPQRCIILSDKAVQKNENDDLALIHTKKVESIFKKVCSRIRMYLFTTGCHHTYAYGAETNSVG